MSFARRPTVVFAGRFCEQKGVLYALAAIRSLRAQHRDVELRVVGDETMTDGAYAARVYAYVREHRLEGCVKMLGFLDHEACLAEIRRADVFLAPSIVDDAGVGEGGAHHDPRREKSARTGRGRSYHSDVPAARHHTISAFLLERFARDTKRGRAVAMLDKTTGKPTSVSPRDAAVRRHFYSIDVDDGQRDTGVEGAISQLNRILRLRPGSRMCRA